MLALNGTLNDNLAVNNILPNNDTLVSVDTLSLKDTLAFNDILVVNDILAMTFSLAVYDTLAVVDKLSLILAVDDKLETTFRLQCELCGKDIKNLDGHLKKLRCEKQFPCNICDEKFRTQTDLKKHTHV